MKNGYRRVKNKARAFLNHKKDMKKYSEDKKSYIEKWGAVKNKGFALQIRMNALF